MTTLYANPYDINCTGFYFTDTEEFNQLMDQAPFEEVEINYVEGDNPWLFASASIHQGNIDTWFTQLDHIDDGDFEAIAITYLLETYKLDDALSKHGEVILHQGNITDYVSELIDEIYPLEQLPDIIKHHIDYSSIARDMELNGEVTQVDSSNTWVVNCLAF